MDDLEDLPASMLCLEDPLIKAKEEEDEEGGLQVRIRPSLRRHAIRSIDLGATSKAKEEGQLDLSEVPINLPPIPSDRPGSASRFKGVSKNKKQ